MTVTWYEAVRIYRKSQEKGISFSHWEAWRTYTKLWANYDKLTESR